MNRSSVNHRRSCCVWKNVSRLSTFLRASASRRDERADAAVVPVTRAFMREACSRSDNIQPQGMWCFSPGEADSTDAPRAAGHALRSTISIHTESVKRGRAPGKLLVSLRT